MALAAIAFRIGPIISTSTLLAQAPQIENVNGRLVFEFLDLN